MSSPILHTAPDRTHSKKAGAHRKANDPHLTPGTRQRYRESMNHLMKNRIGSARNGTFTVHYFPPGHKQRYINLTMYHPLYERARERNRTAAYRRERRRRQTIAEGTFASLDRLSWARSRLRGLWKVGCEGYMAALAHNILKMVRRLGHGVGPPGPVSPAIATAMSSEPTKPDPAASRTGLRLRFFRLCWLGSGLTPALR